MTDSLLLDGLYEQVQLPGGVIEHKFRVGNAQVVQRSNNTSSVHYFHSDGLGSTVAVTSQAKNVLQQLTYDPWGRQYAVHTRSSMLSYSLPGDSKGYTGHRMVKGFEVVHMGGRTYNPFIGRFMQPDPFIQAPLNMQNYNRYSYVLNNPMSYTDPSGYNFLKKGLKFVMKATGSWYVHKFIAQNQLLSGIVNVGLNFIPGCQVWCSAVFSAEQAFVTTGSLRAGIKAGAISAASSYAFQQIGSYYETNAAGNISFGGNMMTSGQIAGQITTHAMVGGVTSSLQGGKFGHGFFAAGVTKGLGTPLLDATASQNVVAGTVISATIGGTASVIAGGKFANGAVTGAMQALYNYFSEPDWGFESLEDKSVLKASLDEYAASLKIGVLNVIELNSHGEISGPGLSFPGPMTATFSSDGSIALGVGPLSYGPKGVTLSLCSHGGAGGVCGSITGSASSPKAAAAIRNVNRATRPNVDPQSGRVRVWLHERMAPTFVGPGG